MLLINFSYNINDFEKFIKENPLENDSHIIDFASSISKDQPHTVLYPSDLDSDNSIHKAALSDYLNEMGKVSLVKQTGNPAKDIRSLNYDGLPLYWLTNISEKHPQNCVLKNVFYFKHLLHKFDTAKKITVILPLTGINFSGSIKAFLVTKGINPGHISFNGNYFSNFTTRSYISYLRNFYNQTNQVRKNLKNINNTSDKNETLIFTYFPQTWKGDKEGDQILNGIEHYSETFKKKVKYVPYFFEYNLIPENVTYQKWDTTIFNCFPSKLNTLLFCLKMLKLFKNVKNNEYNFSENSFVDNTAIKHELNDLLQNNMEYVFNYSWLTRYFKKINHNVKVFYQDEFYIPGRIISSAVKKSANKKITTYGVQHGIFYEAHTVYSITNDELSSTNTSNSYPLPHYFTVWGNYFKSHFLKFNSLKENFIIIAGNIKYIKINQNRFPKLLDSETSGKTRMLWCTTMQIDVINQYKKLLKQFLNDNPSVDIIVRCHPLVNLEAFICNELVTQEQQNRFSFSEKVSIFEDMAGSDVVLSTSGSTIFLDAMVIEKPIFNLVNDDYYMGDLGSNEMENICNKTDLQNAFNSFLTTKRSKKDYSKILDLDPDKWLQILN